MPLENGKVTVPKSFHELWRLWNEGGWRRIDLPQEMGGHGMPVIVGMAANEYFEAANLAFQTLAAMTRGAALLIATYGTENQKKKYVEKILSGKWTGTMVLTEPGAGSDVGATTTKAERNPDGTYSIVGSKIFITGGNTDLTENIVHLVLARVKGAPAGHSGSFALHCSKDQSQSGRLSGGRKRCHDRRHRKEDGRERGSPLPIEFWGRGEMHQANS